MGVTSHRTSRQTRNRFHLPASRAPLGTPGLYPPHTRDSRNNIQPRIQILARPTEPPKVNTESFPTLSRPASSASQSVLETQSNISTISGVNTSEMSGYGDMNGDVTRSYQLNDPFRFPPVQSTRLVEGNESPPSMAPTSLEDYVVYKPSVRKDRRVSKPPVPSHYPVDFGVEASHNAQAMQPIPRSNNEFQRSNLQRILDEGLVKSKVPTEMIKDRLLTDFPNFTVATLGALFSYPLDVGDANGSLRRTRHSNGDVSVFQWASTSFYWVHVGRIPYAQVEQFSTLLGNIYSDSQHFNMREHKLARARIAAMVQQFCDKKVPLITRDRATSPVSKTIYNYQNQTDQSSVTPRDEFKSAFSTPPHSRFTKELDAHHRGTSVGISPQFRGTNIGTSGNRVNSKLMFQRRDAIFENVESPQSQPSASHFTPESHPEYRGRERQRHTPNDGMLPAHAIYNFKMDHARNDSVTMRELVKGDTIQPRNIQAGTQDYRRADFQERDRGNSAGTLPLAKQIALPPQVRASQLSHLGQKSIELSRTSTTDSLFQEGGFKRNSEPETKLGDRSINAPQPLRRSTLTDEELRASIPLVPQSSKGPFLTGGGLDPFTGVANGEISTYPSQKDYNSELDAFWYSGMKTAQRQKEYIKHYLAAHKMSEETHPNAVTAIRVMLPMVERLQAYAPRGRAAGNVQQRDEDYFAKYSEPPEWCVNKSLEDTIPGRWFSGKSRKGEIGGGLGFSVDTASTSRLGTASGGGIQSLLGEAEWLGAPERVGRDPRYRPLIAAEVGMSLRGIGSGRIFR